MSLELAEEERVMLLHLLHSALAETREDIHRTASFDFKEGVKLRKKLIEDLLERLGLETAVHAL
jgi:hypothetical protein